MRLLVTGRDGQVARALQERAASDARFQVLAVGRPGLDLARPETVAAAVEAAEPDVIVSAAAYTAVDRAEDEPDLAMVVNAAGPRALAEAAERLAVPVIHLSTDYVFDGALDRPYREDDPTGPQGQYGRTKLAGENAVREAAARHIILRTAWVYSPFGHNFVRTMLRLARERDEVSVVSDQRGNPTSALDIADGILAVAEAVTGKGGFDGWGTYHLAGTGSTDWASFARAIFAASEAQGGPHARVRDIATADYPTKAKRPANSRLETAKLSRTFGWQAPAWQGSTELVVKRLVASAQG